MNYIFRESSFHSYGLNKFRNFLHCPVKENIMYDAYNQEINLSTITINDDQELMDLMCNILNDCDCDNAGIFVHKLNGTMYAGVTDGLDCEIDEDDDMCFSLEIMSSTEPDDMEFFNLIDAEYRLCCYGLLIEVLPNEYRIVTW